MYYTTAIHPKKEQRPFMQFYRMSEKQKVYRHSDFPHT